MTPERFAKIRAVLRRRQPDLTVMAENVYKSHNIAALMRTCDATGVYRIHAVSSEGEFPRHHMVAAGTGKWVKSTVHHSVQTAVDNLRSSGFKLYAAHLSEAASDYRDVDYTSPCAIMLGSEINGVSDNAADLADRHIMIPMRGMVDSLNVSVANALILYEAARQRESAGLYDESRLPAAEFDTTLFEWCYPDIARRCREKDLPYPDLDEQGYFHQNPLNPDSHNPA